MRQFKTVITFIGFSLALIGPLTTNETGRAAEADPTPGTMFATLRDQLNSVHMIRLRAVSRGKSPSPQDPTGAIVIENRTETLIKNDKFLINSQIINPALKGPVVRIHAFDGVEYQSIDEQKGILVTNRLGTADRRAPAYFMPQPFMIMFNFALDGALNRDYPALKQAELWNRVAAKSCVTGRGSVKSIPCVVVEVDGLETGKSATLYLAESLGYYPLKVEYRTEVFTRVDVVEEFETVADGARSLIVPTKVSTTGVVNSSKIKSTSVLSVKTGSLEVNKPVDDIIFMLPRNQVPIHIDMTSGKAYKNGQLIVSP